jgi:hypothetical protein
MTTHHRSEFVTATAAILLAAALPATALAKDPVPPPGNWVSIAKADTQEAFIDESSVRTVEAGWVEAAVKINYAEAIPFGRKKSYQSVRNVYLADCSTNRIADRANAIYPQLDLGGKAVSKASRKEKNLIWRDTVPASIDGEILKSACKRAGFDVTR